MTFFQQGSRNYFSFFSPACSLCLPFSNRAPQQIVMRPPSQSELQPDSPEEILHLVKCYICQFHEDNEEEKIGWRQEGERARARKNMASFLQCNEDSFGSWTVMRKLANRVTVGAFRAGRREERVSRTSPRLFEIPPHHYQGLSHVLDSMHLFSAGYEPELGSWNCYRSHVSKGLC